MKKNILVFPCGSEIGLELYRSLHLSTHVNLIGGSSVSDHGGFVYDNYIDGLPHIHDPNFIDSINKIILKYKIDFIFPAHDSVVLRLAQAKQKKELACGVVTSDVSVCEVARSKRKTYETLRPYIKVPKIYNTVNEIPPSAFPLFLKPDVGQGSKGVYRARDIGEVEFYRSKDPSLLMLEFLPGKEFTVDCFTSSKGHLMFCEGRERIRVQNGISVSSATVKDLRFHDIAQKINAHLKFNGVWFFQVKEDVDGELVLLEIAPRVAGTMGLERAKGVNLPLLSIFNALEVPISITENEYDITIDRALDNRFRHNIEYSHVYIDFDDLVIFKDKVNVEIIAFLFQCLNHGKKIYLLTRHKDDISKSLQKHRLAGIFDEVIWIQNNENKSEYIEHQDAIFIDDSFAERLEVSKKKNIPVFDGHMVECLMD